ncbi:MAG: dihydrofolate reductase [Verrucomicrobiae bacterium]|nr:dihydrofolate reductase [Verrucomicrobiae bacterium]
MRPWIAVAAMSENRAIGRAGAIPWHLPEDFRWFKRLTMGHTLVMGRKTFDSIGRPLPGRQTIVLSRAAAGIPGTDIARDPDEIGRIATGDKIFICGGEEIYRLLIPRCSEVFLTLVKRTVDGDRFLPAFENDFAPPDVLQDNPEFRILHYRRRPAPGARGCR